MHNGCHKLVTYVTITITQSVIRRVCGQTLGRVRVRTEIGQ